MNYTAPVGTAVLSYIGDGGSPVLCVYIGWEQSVRSDPAQYVLKDELEK